MLERRVYTIAEAKRTLPLVQRIVADIVAASRDLERQEDAEGDEAQLLAARLRKYAQELEAMGIELKDPRTGLVDYYWRRGDETVYLCWRHGEPEIAHWHDLEAGFAGRRRLDAVDFSLDAARG